MSMAADILAPIVPPDPARSTPRDRQAFIAQHCRLYARDLALEDVLDPPPPEPPLPALPDAGEPMPDHLAAVWDRMTPLEHTLIKGGRIWQAAPDQHWTRINVCVAIFRKHGLGLADAIAMCRFPDGLGAHMPKHAAILRTLWQLDQQPRNWRWAEHLEAAMGFGGMCKASPQEVAITAKAEWQRAQRHAMTFLEALRRRLWPMCRTLAPEQAVIAEADAVMQDFGIYVPDVLLMPLLKGIWNGAQPRRRRAGGLR